MTRRLQGFWVGASAGMVVTIMASFAARFVVPATALESQNTQPNYQTVLENDRVRVRDVTFPPGVLDTGMHTHEYAHVGVILTKGTLVFTDPDGTVNKVAFEVGSTGFRDAKATHMVANPGPAPMRVIEVELK
jgi:oxalate decarboxylase/phosphoglucose isomerase-like protein (cupin superfamily)